MNDLVVDLWPNLHLEKVRSPKTILKEQADLLSHKTNNILKGEIGSVSSLNETTIGFSITSPYLNNYKYQLFFIRFNPATLYPVFLDGYGECNDESTFVEKVKEILSDARTIKIINSLYSQSLEETESV